MQKSKWAIIKHYFAPSLKIPHIIYFFFNLLCFLFSVFLQVKKEALTNSLNITNLLCPFNLRLNRAEFAAGRKTYPPETTDFSPRACNGNNHCKPNVGLLFGLQRLIRSSPVGKGTFFNAIPLLLLAGYWKYVACSADRPWGRDTQRKPRTAVLFDAGEGQVCIATFEVKQQNRGKSCETTAFTTLFVVASHFNITYLQKLIKMPLAVHTVTWY